VRKMLDVLARIWVWLLVGIGAIVALLFIRDRRRLRNLRDRHALVQAMGRVDRLAALRSQLEVDAGKNAAAIADVDAEIKAQRVRAVRAFHEGATLEGEELEQAFAELGF
jgi:hypothetical protein